MQNRPNLSYDQNGSVYEGGPLTRLSSNTSAAITTTPAFIHTINVTKAGTAWNLKLYDAPDATDATKLVMDMDCNAIGSFQVYGLCKTALFAVTSGTTPGSVTIAYSDQNSY